MYSAILPINKVGDLYVKLDFMNSWGIFAIEL